MSETHPLRVRGHFGVYLGDACADKLQAVYGILDRAVFCLEEAALDVLAVAV